MSRTTNRGVFNASLLPEAQPRWDLFSAGFGLQLVAVTALVVIPLLMPEKLTMVQHYWTTPVEAPPIVAWKPQPPPPQPKQPVIKEIVKPTPKVEPVVAPPVELPKPKVYNPVVAKAVTPVTRKPTTAPEAAEVAKAFPDPNPPMSMGSSALPTLKKPREAVQTGGFGDVDGVKDNGKTNKNPNINVGGSYDMPNGPGVGNGTGGAKGAKGVTGSAGFGNGVAVGGPGGGGPQRQVQTGGFDEKAADTTAKAAKGPTPPPMTHVQVTSIVKPTYSDEGRAKKIEGDVTLQVTFTANGQVQILRVVRGLGSGLDEAAEAAARQIRFKPAMQGGQPVDETTNIHITFALAN
jgi:TonB family protein